MHMTFAKTLGVIGLMTALFQAPLHAAPPPSAFGVWDRSDKFDVKDFPFIKGFSFEQQ